MAGRGAQTFKKRQKEQQRKEKQQEKLAKRQQKKQDGEKGSGPEVDWNFSIDGEEPLHRAPESQESTTLSE